MSLRLKVFYIVAILISLGIAFTGTDALYPPDRQVFYIITGKTLPISAPEGAILMFGGIGLILISLAGLFVDKRSRDRK